MGASEDDWRRMGQEASLKPGTRLIRKCYRAPRPDWDHDHCSFCNVKFVSPDAAVRMPSRELCTEGYTTTSDFARGADYEWVCSDCCADFAQEFGWMVAEP